jgi:hypothetical protein
MAHKKDAFADISCRQQPVTCLSAQPFAVTMQRKWLVMAQQHLAFCITSGVLINLSDPRQDRDTTKRELTFNRGGPSIEPGLIQVLWSLGLFADTHT